MKPKIHQNLLPQLSVLSKTIVFLCLMSLMTYNKAIAQTQEPTKPFIEITGTSETEVVPDEIYITITLLERMEGKEKLKIEKQEADLKQNLKELGIDPANLSLNSADADFGKVRKSNKDVLVSKSYVLKVGNTDMIAKVYERLDKINAQDAYISRMAHSKILDLQKENRIKAMKAAKEKVDYLLAALGQSAGKPLEIREMDNYIENNQGYPKRGGYPNAVQAFSSEAADGGAEMSFKKIKIRSSFLVKYEILNK
jgi:uncharacterized protein